MTNTNALFIADIMFDIRCRKKEGKSVKELQIRGTKEKLPLILSESTQRFSSYEEELKIANKIFSESGIKNVIEGSIDFKYEILNAKFSSKINQQ